MVTIKRPYLCVLLLVVFVLGWLPRIAVAQQSGKPTPPLADPGPYVVGERIMTLVDTSRDNRSIGIAMWYPAVLPANPAKGKADSLEFSHRGWPNAAPDPQAAPYPLILLSSELAGSNLTLTQFTKPLAERGFVVVALDHPQDRSQLALINRPLDILFVINQLAAITEGDLAGVIDTNHVGVMGWALGSYTALSVSGARIDPDSASAWASKPLVPGSEDDGDPRNDFADWNWNELAAYRTKLSPLPPGELWPPFTDKRIQAVLAFTVCDITMFGEKGLAAVTMPVMMIAGVNDGVCPYEHGAIVAYAHLGSQNRYLITFAHDGFSFYGERKYWPVLNHFETAFFGYYLQGHQDYAQYLTADNVNSLEAQVNMGLVWGPYSGGQ